jgi:hypothetical protein
MIIPTGLAIENEACVVVLPVLGPKLSKKSQTSWLSSSGSEGKDRTIPWHVEIALHSWAQSFRVESSWLAKMLSEANV